MEELQKEGVIDEKGNVDMDTGAIIFSINFIESLFSLSANPEEGFRCLYQYG